MSTINQLSEASAVSSSMQIPVYDAGNGQPRKVSVAQLQEFMQENPGAVDSPVALPQLSVAELASFPAATWTGCAVYCSNGNSGVACLAISNGTSWLRIALGAAVSAS